MNSKEISTAAKKSIKWSFLGELFAKIATPISTMALARLLSPEIFGIATAVTIIVTFCESVTESGFSKFLIQHDFESKEDYKNHFSVSFYISIFLSMFLCTLIFLLKKPLSSLVGNSGYEMVLVVSSLQIPFASINALFSADLKRLFKFKKLFYIRVIYCAIPFIITIPLALLGLSYWSLVIGSIAAQIVQLPFLLFASKGNVKFYFSFKVLKNTIKISFPMIFESAIIWFCTWTGTVIAANFFNARIVGIVKVSSSTVNNIFALFATAFTSVLFPALSRLKKDDKEYQNTFYSIQSAALSILVPLGVGSFFYSKLLTDIFLGDGWAEAAFVISVYSLTRPLMICFNNFMSEVFRSKGHFYSSILYQLSMLFVDILLKFTVGKISYELFIWTTVFANLFTTFLAISILKFKYKFSVMKQAKSFFPAALCSAIMIPFLILGTNTASGILISLGQVVTCAGIYFAALGVLFPNIFNNSMSFIIRPKHSSV